MSALVEEARAWLMAQAANADASADQRANAERTLAWMTAHPGKVPRWVARQLPRTFEREMVRSGCVVDGCGRVPLYRVGAFGFCGRHKQEASERRAHAGFAYAQRSDAKARVFQAQSDTSLTHSADRRHREALRRGTLAEVRKKA